VQNPVAERAAFPPAVPLPGAGGDGEVAEVACPAEPAASSVPMAASSAALPASPDGNVIVSPLRGTAAAGVSGNPSKMIRPRCSQDDP